VTILGGNPNNDYQEEEKSALLEDFKISRVDVEDLAKLVLLTI
jgi:hypothetical protein